MKNQRYDLLDLLRHTATMDWSKMSLPTPKNARPQVGELATLDYWKLVVASKLVKKSLAAMLQTAVYNYLEHNWESHEKRMIIEANAAGMTPEEYFMKIVSEEIEAK